MREDPERRKIALVATAHWLVRVMGAMLRTGECWRETKLEAVKIERTAAGTAGS
jgi:hypothetical protein